MIKQRDDMIYFTNENYPSGGVGKKRLEEGQD